ncbi:MAG: Hpt domain-containing protein [Polaromonas sp.]|nr:Hpt domain-containing protein [Polaromonas sp.]
MQPNATPPADVELDLAVNDLGPLAWVLDELRKSLDSAAKALKRFVRDAESARGSDLAALDASQLRIARQQLHQAVGALEMVGLAGPALVLRAMEAAVQKFVQQPEQCTQEAASRIERASFALTEYLEGVLADKQVTPVSLFPQYRDVQELVRADRIHPADLWPQEWRWNEPGLAMTQAPLSYDAATRSRFEQSVLQVMKGKAPQAAGQLKELLLGLAAAQAERQPRIFWVVAAAYLEALEHDLLDVDVHVKRAASRLLMQYASLAKGDHTVSERLAHDLLFFCSQAISGRASDTPVLSAVRSAYGLARFKPVNYDTVQFGRFDPALLAQARKRIASAKENWSSLSAGDANKFKSVADQFSLVSDSLVKLHPPSEPLAVALTRVVDATVRSGHAPSVEISMEIATAILYLEAAFDDLDPNDPQLAARTAHLAERLEHVRSGGEAQPLESWMEELYRRVSDKQTMGSVVGELRVSLGELEKSLDLFFRNPDDKTVLRDVPGQLSQMRGVLSVLGLEQASQAVLRMRETVEGMLVTEVDGQKARAAGTFDNLGNNLGALSFLIDMLNYQPALAKKLFVYDDANGELKPLMGRTHAPAAAESVTVTGDMLSQEAMSLVQQADAGADDDDLTVRLDALSTQAAIAGQPALAQTAHEASLAMSGDDAAATATALTSLASAVAATPAPVAAPTEDFEEDDLRDIFLEEAREVAGNGQQALLDLAGDPGDIGQLTVLRRVFHTLKGSARMVGLNEFGEAAWGLEQMLNSWLADQKPATPEMLSLAGDALTGFSAWIEDIAGNRDSAWSAVPFKTSAEAMRSDARLVPLVLPAAAAAPAHADADVLLEMPSFDLPVRADQTPLGAASDQADGEVLPQPDAAAEVTAPGGFGDFDFDLGLPDAGAAQPVAASGEPVPDAVLAISASADTPSATAPAATTDSMMDFDAFFGDDEPPAAPTPDSAAASQPAVEIQGIDFDSLSALSAAHDSVAPDDSTPAAFQAFDLPADMEATVSFQAQPAAAPVFEDIELSAMDVPDLQPAQATSATDLPAFGDAELTAEDLEMAFPSGAAADPAPSVTDASAPADAAGFFDFDLQPASADATPTVVATAAEADTPVEDAVTGFAPDPDAFTGTPLSSEAADAPGHPPQQTLSEIEDALDAPADEQVKVIGSLRIGIPLYNVYLNEADEWSRRLVTEVSEWSLEPHHAVADSTVALAHSLAGSSATVGFDALSEMARALEHALQQSQGHYRNGVAAEYAGLFVDAAEDIRRLLHQFAAGFLKESQPGLLAQLREVDFPDQVSVFPPEMDEADFAAVDQAPDSMAFAEDAAALEEFLAAEEAGFVKAAAQEAAADSSTGSTSSGLADSAPTFNSPPAFAAVHQINTAPQRVHSEPTGDFRHGDDDIDAVDVIDPELFPIFEEEGAELMPQLGGALRQWSARPENLSARAEVLRVLHTLKGSARLAGALRMGEMAHRIESEIEHLGSDAAATQEFEPLMARFDAMQTAFDVLRQADAEAAAMPLQPLEAVVAEEEVQVSAPLADVPGPASDTADEAPAIAEEIAAESGTVPSTAVGLPAARPLIPAPQTLAMQPVRQAANASIRVRSQLLDRMVNQAGEVMITRSRLEAELGNLRGSLNDMSGNLNRLRQQLRDIELQAETQMQSRLAQAKEAQAGFDPLEFDRFTRVQELTRMMAESVNDVATVQRTLQRTVEATEDDLIAQARQTRELQRDLLRTRMVEFEGISDRLYRVVRQASKDTGKQVKLDLLGGTIEMDRGMLDRMTPAFEHLLRNCVAHGIELPEARTAAGKDVAGLITVHLRQEGNDVSVEFSDDGAGLDVARIRDKAVSAGLIDASSPLSDDDAASLIFMPGFSTATQVTELSGRGIGMDVVRAEINAVGGRIETSTVRGQGTRFKLVLPLTTAVTQVVMIRSGNLSVGVPANVVETVRRTTGKELQQAYNSGVLDIGGESIPFFWSGALLQSSHHSADVQGKTTPVVIFRSAAQRLALHVDEVLGNQEVVVKNLGPQLARLPGLAGMSVLASGAVVLIYNPVALASVYGQQARGWSTDLAEPHMLEAAAGSSGGGAVAVPQAMPMAAPQIPLVLVVDDSITVRRVTQRLLQREGYRVSMAADGLQALERLQEERPAVVLSDIEMPRMDGFDLARNIRADARLKDLPIVMITSRIAEKHREHARELGVDHYLGKPYSEEELLSLVRHYCSAEVTGQHVA